MGSASEPDDRASNGPEPLALPVLDAGAFRLRSFARDDLDTVREASFDPLIPLITTVPSPFTDAGGVAFIERQWSRMETGRGWSWAIVRTDTDQAIGQVGLWPQDDGRASIGYWVVASARGEGAAGHAVRTVCRFAFADVRLRRLELRIEPGNGASIRTAERSGFTFEGVLHSFATIGGERRDLAMYARLDR